MQNPFNKLFAQTQQAAAATQFADKFTPKPYQQAYRHIYTLCTGAGYLLQVVAASAVAYFIFNLLNNLTGTAIAVIVALIAAAGVEAAKRATAERVAVNYLMYKSVSVLAVASLLMVALSTYAAYMGADKAIIAAHGTAPTASADQQTAAYHAQIAAASDQIATAKKQTWQGKITPKAVKQIDRAQQQIDRAQSRIIEIEQRTEAANDRTEIDHTSTAQGNGRTFGLLMLLCELLIIVCVAYANYYQYRTVVEGKVKIIAPETKKVLSEYPTEKHPINGTRAIVEGFVTRSGSISCEHCNTQFTPNHKKQKYCKTACRVAAHGVKTGNTPPTHWNI